ncbi:hypothetical protein SLITO_v1c09500 [Spiroplasma litorale]|uniref:Uncharacterized protein n=1 Tax=Spiroplasma litorale TaxID=216942 RepID=A0A0K1W306_9MOLU|nr:hypothetical protein [Spiroplasma litorale]AKX34561.1 hypothetical protein SLITO_v1c09500 [Spiroplasma litorale]
MLFDRVEIIYEKYFLPIKIKFSESRKPTFIEFLILSIFLEYHDDKKSLKKILEEDFNIKNQILFEKALRDLINFQILSFKEFTLSVGETNTNLPLNKFNIKDDIKKSFNTESFVISNNNKYYDIKYYYDPISNDCEIVKDLYWLKKLPKVKLGYKIMDTQLKKELFNKDFIIDVVKKFILNNEDIIGNNPKVLDVLSQEQQDLNNFKLIEKSIKKETIAFESSIELNVDGKFEVYVEDKNLKEFIDRRPELKNNIVKKVLQQYKNSLDNVFLIKDEKINHENFHKEIDLISNINVSSNWNLLLINDQHIVSHEDLFKNNELFKNMEFIIIYNSKRNSNELKLKNNKIIIYLSDSEDNFLKSTTFTYISSDNKIKSFLISNMQVDQLNINFPVTYLAKTKNLDINISFNKFFKEFQENFYKDLIYKDFDSAKLYYKVLERFGKVNAIKEILTTFITESIKNYESFNLFKKYIKDNNLQNLEKTFRELTPDAVAIGLNNINNNDKLNVLQNLNINSKTTILKILNKLEINLDIDKVYKINEFLLQKNIDAWELNVLNCVNIMIEYFRDNLRENNFIEDRFKDSECYVKHARLLNNYATMIKNLYKQNYAYVEDIYYDFIIDLMEVMNKYLPLNKDYIVYLSLFSDILKEFYKLMFDYQIEYFSQLDKNQIKYKVFYIAANYISRVEKEINVLLKIKEDNSPVELKLFLLKMNYKEDLKVQKYIEINQPKIEKALKIIFGTKPDYNQEFLSTIRNELGDN